MLFQSEPVRTGPDKDDDRKRGRCGPAKDVKMLFQSEPVRTGPDKDPTKTRRERRRRGESQ
jgi:hypothetical protein